MQNSPLKWLAVVAVVGLSAWLIPRACSTALKHEGDNATQGDKKATPPVTLARDAEGRRIFTVSKEVQERVGLTVQKLTPSQMQPHVRAIGQIEADPSQSFMLRSPVAGFLAIPDGTTWPRLGERISAGATIGSVRPRLSPVERYDLSTRLMQAHADVEEINADLVAAKSSYENKKRLNENGKVVSDRALEEAQAKVKSGEARLQASVETVRLLEDAMVQGRNQQSALPLVAQRAGEIVEMLAQPGEAVESGQLLLKTDDFAHLIARVTVSPGTILSQTPISAQIQVLGEETDVFQAKVISCVPADASAGRGQTFLASIDVGDKLLRPGMAVAATLESAGTPIEGVIVPRSAIIRFGGSTYVYVQSDEEQFTRKQFEAEAPDEAGSFVRRGLTADDRVVVVGAGILLSEELRAQIEAEAEGEE
ncbi:MAG: HlyD family efflux transporter periplasmic adaptor subunit [Planctomycetia bacterium]|jgi:hypothetical protein|nr:HlyD family efflux transporter periplasmic adaptor subunit [Planctomycetia bacterium]MCC7316223.1 HlyD family efflux transporter periplasmic adaptor subunit [Planctomycetota bacterium]OQZ06034.1 MAG: hypothetical protein B6D36_07040 [Planctomycetes bacterium UTPLA1]